MRKELFLRTDVLPEEIPLLFTNKAVYNNFTRKTLEEEYDKKSKTLLSLESVPLFYRIPKSQNEKRKMALLHPIAQIQSFNYILKYEQLITSFCKNSPFSVRSPIKRNIPKINRDHRKKELEKIEEEFNFNEKLAITSDEDKIYYYNYFSYKKYKKIQDLYNSPRFNRDKYKYSFFLKMDIQRFFPSIYTHSLAWAIFGDKALAKKYKQENNAFPNATDKIVQIINFNETHGIVVGPEFSRVIAELLLTRIDINLHHKLKCEYSLTHKKDYTLYRYVDDYFLFTHREEQITLIESILVKELEKYNLTLNVWKSELQKKPINTDESAIFELKKTMKIFELDKKKSVDIRNEKNTKEYIHYDEFLGTRYQWQSLFVGVEMIISNNIEAKTKIVNFFLKSIRTSIHFSGNHHNVIKLILEIVSNIYTLDINNKSTHYLISIFYKILNQVQSLKQELKQKKQDCIDDKERMKYKNEIENLIQIEEKLFQHSFSILKNNIHEIENMYDLLVFMKLLNKKLSSSFLCKILSLNRNSYFVCCSVANYIINDYSKSLNLSFKTVKIKLHEIMKSNINHYVSKGAKYTILEADFFYILNDFSKYPGFRPGTRRWFERKLKNEINKTLNRDIDSNEELQRLWNAITQNSYYDWNSRPKDFIRKVVKKSSNTHLDTSSDY